MTDDHNEPPEFDDDMPDSLLPYDAWLEDAYRDVMLRAIEHASQNGLPGDHHFYLTFRTDAPGVDIPARLRAQYPQDMTIVLQHQFWDLAVDRERGTISVGLSFGGVGSMLVIPIRAVSAFADPHVKVAMRFAVDEESLQAAEQTEADATPQPEATPETASIRPAAEESGEAQVVSLDAFRRKPPARD